MSLLDGPLTRKGVKEVRPTSEQQRVVSCDIRSLHPWRQYARKHSKAQLKQIAASIKAFGFTNPVLIDRQQTILAGHGRVAAAQLLGWTLVPCLYVEHMSEVQKRAYVLADNQVALNVTWDESFLSEELQALSEADLGFDLDLNGFSTAEIDELFTLDAREVGHDPKDDRLPEAAPRCVQPEDIWSLGSHGLICGDSLDAAVVDALMQEGRAGWCSPTLPTMCPWRVMSVVRGRLGIANLRWRPVGADVRHTHTSCKAGAEGQEG